MTVPVTYKDSISRVDLSEFRKLVATGNETAAIDLFISRYIKPHAIKYTGVIKNQLSVVEKQELLARELSAISITVQGNSLAYERATNSLYAMFYNEVVAPVKLKMMGITSRQANRIIKENTLSFFTEKTKEALSGTNANVLSAIRKYQTDLMTANIKIANRAKITGVLDKEVKVFTQQMRDEVRKMNPDFYRMLDEGKLIRSKPDARGIYRNYKLEDYADMSVRTTLLNVDRTAHEVQLQVDDVPIAELYLRDHRPLKGEERPICAHILATKFYGRAVLALNSETGSKLGMMTIADYRAQGGFGPNCRHSIRKPPDAYIAKVKRGLFVGEAGENLKKQADEISGPPPKDGGTGLPEPTPPIPVTPPATPPRVEPPTQVKDIVPDYVSDIPIEMPGEIGPGAKGLGKTTWIGSNNLTDTHIVDYIEQNVFSRPLHGPITGLRKLDRPILDRSIQQLERLNGKYQNYFDGISVWKSKSTLKNTYAAVSYDTPDGRNRSIDFFFGPVSKNNKYSEIRNKVSSDVASGWHPRGGNTWESIVTHEYAHMLTGEVTRSMRTNMNTARSIYTATSGRFAASKMAMAHELQAVYVDYTRQLREGVLSQASKHFVSRYATTNLEEFISESFSMYIHCEDPSDFALRVGKIIDKYCAK